LHTDSFITHSRAEGIAQPVADHRAERPRHNKSLTAATRHLATRFYAQGRRQNAYPAFGWLPPAGVWCLRPGVRHPANRAL